MRLFFTNKLFHASTEKVPTKRLIVGSKKEYVRQEYLLAELLASENNFVAMNMSNWLDPSRPKLPPGALFAIPDDLLADIYTIWLRLKDVCRLDSAVCSKIWRPPFLRLVSTKVLRFNREEIDVLVGINLCTSTHQHLELPEMNWILKRGIHLATLRVYLNYFSKSVDSKWIQSFDVAIKDLLKEGHLDKLETLDMAGDCSYIKDAVLAAILEKSYNSLTCIDLRFSGLTKSSAAHIKRCTGLEAFAAKGNESSRDMVEIVQSCPKLCTVI